MSATSRHVGQRVSAVAVGLSGIPLIAITVLCSGGTYEEARELFGNPFAGLLLATFSVSASYHMRLGMKMVLEDYVSAGHKRLALTSLNTLVCGLTGIAGVFAAVFLAATR